MPIYLLAISLGLSLICCIALSAWVARLLRRLKHAAYLIKETRRIERRRSEEKVNMATLERDTAQQERAEALEERDQMKRQYTVVANDLHESNEARKEAERRATALQDQLNQLLVTSVTHTANSQEPAPRHEPRPKEIPKNSGRWKRISVPGILLSLVLTILFHAFDASIKPSLELDVPIVSVASFILSIVFSPDHTSS